MDDTRRFFGSRATDTILTFVRLESSAVIYLCAKNKNRDLGIAGIALE